MRNFKIPTIKNCFHPITCSKLLIIIFNVGRRLKLTTTWTVLLQFYTEWWKNYLQTVLTQNYIPLKAISAISISISSNFSQIAFIYFISNFPIIKMEHFVLLTIDSCLSRYFSLTTQHNFSRTKWNKFKYNNPSELK